MSSMTSDERNASEEQDFNVEDQHEHQEPERDELDDMLDNDPDTRAQVKAEMRRLLQRGYQSQYQQEPQEQERREPVRKQPVNALQQVRSEIDQADQELDQFFETPESDRNYEQFERLKLKKERLRRKEELVRESMQEQSQALGRADAVVDAWIREKAATDREVTKYSARIKELAQGLRPNIRADENQLRQALEYMVEPNAYKEYRKSERSRQSNRRRDASSQNAYTDDDGDEAPRQNDKYADASPEEREFLRSVGLLKEDRKKQDGGLIPTEDGYIIPIGRGKRNASNGQGGQ